VEVALCSTTGCGTRLAQGTQTNGSTGEVYFTYTAASTTTAYFAVWVTGLTGTGNFIASEPMFDVGTGEPTYLRSSFSGVGNATGGLVTNQIALAGGSYMNGNQGTGAKVQHSTGATTNGDAVIYDSAGNTIDSGAPPAGIGIGNGSFEQSRVLSSSAPYFSSGSYTCSGTIAYLGASSVNNNGPSLEATSATAASTINQAGCVESNYGVTAVAYLPSITYLGGFVVAGDYASGTQGRMQTGLLYIGGCSAATFLASDTPSCNYVTIRYSNIAGDTTYQCVSDNGSGTPNVVAITGATPTTGTSIFQVALTSTSSATCTVTSPSGTSYSATTASKIPGTNTTLSVIGENTTISASTPTAVHWSQQAVKGQNAASNH
jgi:hypothetical protein